VYKNGKMEREGTRGCKEEEKTWIRKRRNRQEKEVKMERKMTR
jgi:hypothetical protein